MLVQIVFLFFLVCGLGSKCVARVDVKNTKLLVLPTDPSPPILSAEESQKILPKAVAPGQSGSSVISQMVDNSFSLWWNESPIKSTAIGQAADSVEKNLKTEVSLGKSADQKTEHKISVKLLAMQALAKIEYKGWVRAGLNYDARAAKTKAEVLQNISEHQDLSFSQTLKSGESNSQVSLLWNW